VRLICMRFTRQSFTFVFFITAVCFAQIQFPDTPAGHQVAAWLQAFNSGNREKRHDFLQKNRRICRTGPRTWIRSWAFGS
jgi:hypothetical protein